MLNNDFQKLGVTGLITLYQLDASNVGAGVFYFHGHNDGDIVWQGKTYHAIAITADGLEMRGDGKASTPTLHLANVFNGIVGGLSALCLQFNDLVGAKLTVIHTLAKYLDGQPTASSEHKKQTWYIEQKTDEDHSQVSFELSNPVDFEGQKIPLRQITGYCNWAVCGRYRGEECGYMGVARFTKDGQPTEDASQDKCGGRLSDCKLRFGEYGELPFGGYPASSLV